jgi:hypothetical protein
MEPYIIYHGPCGVTLTNVRGEILDEYNEIDSALEYVDGASCEIVEVV